MDTAAVRERLRRLGLTETEVTTYLTLLRIGELTAAELADEADVSQGYLYDVLDGLADRELVVLNDHVTPTTVRPRPPEEAIERVVSDLTDLQSTLQRRFTEHDARHPEVDLLRSRQTAYRRLRGLLGDASEEVLLAVPAAAVADLRSALSSARDRGVLVGVLLGGAGDDDGAALAAARDCATVVRTWAERGHQFTATVDRRAAGIGDASILHGQHRPDDHALVVENSRTLTWAVESLTWNFWAAAEEAFVADPVELPASFRSIAHAVVQATLHRRAGTSLAVEATVADDDVEAVAGRLVDVRQTVLEPATGDIGIENGLAVETPGGGVVTLGGAGAFLEDHVATEVRLSVAD